MFLEIRGQFEESVLLTDWGSHSSKAVSLGQWRNTEGLQRLKRAVGRGPGEAVGVHPLGVLS